MNKLQKNKSKIVIRKKLLLNGDPKEIIRLGDIYSKLNNLPIISPSDLSEFLSGKPLYLGKQSKGQWGMSFEDARRCLYDVVRTQKLIKGIVYQINQKKKVSPKEIHVVEAGGGTGILAIAAALAGAKVTLLEINNETVQRTKEFIEFIGLKDKVSVLFADARKYVPHEKIDLIICECLHTGLAMEPQLQILQNLSKYLHPEGKIIPEGVTLRWALADVNWKDIPESHTELRNIEKYCSAKGSWSEDSYIDFYEAIKKSEIEEIRFVMLMDIPSANAYLSAMDITICNDKELNIVLSSGEAQFLGHTHAIKINTIYKSQSPSYAHCSLQPGLEFLHSVRLYTNGSPSSQVSSIESISK